MSAFGCEPEYTGVHWSDFTRNVILGGGFQGSEGLGFPGPHGSHSNSRASHVFLRKKIVLYENLRNLSGGREAGGVTMC